MTKFILHARKIRNAVRSHQGYTFTYYDCFGHNVYFLEEIKDCVTVPSNPSTCYIFMETGGFSADMCQSVSGYPLRLTGPGQAAEVYQMQYTTDISDAQAVWVGLTTDVDT